MTKRALSSQELIEEAARRGMSVMDAAEAARLRGVAERAPKFWDVDATRIMGAVERLADEWERATGYREALIDVLVMTPLGDTAGTSLCSFGATADAILASPWLAAHDAQVAEKAWDEGERHESEYLATWGQFCPGTDCNPYRRTDA